ncbi:MAG: ATP-grasp ribosomal peptide maturase [Pseudonocardiaceae bacterium]
MGEAVVLVVGAVGDWSLDTVASALDRRGVRTFRLTTSDFPQRMTLRAQLGDRWRGPITLAGQTVNVEDVTAVYYRHPRDFDLPTGLSEPERRFAHAQARVGLGGVLASLPARWVNHPCAISDNEYKPRQLATAVAVGFRTPQTLITNDQDAVREFAAATGEIILKPLAMGSLDEAGAISSLYTVKPAPADLADLGSVRVTAHLFQQWIEPQYAVRVTTIGDVLFPVAIHAHSEAARVDWRSDYDAVSYRVTRCPESVTEAIARYLSVMGLRFGAFDFIVDHHDQWWYLETNASGQWGWLAEACDLPMTDAIVAELSAQT